MQRESKTNRSGIGGTMKIHEYNQMMNYLTRKPSPAEIKLNAERVRLAKGTKPDTPNIANEEQLEGLKKRLENARAHVTPPKKKKVARKIPVIPPKPDLMNGHSDWTTDDWLHSIDPSGWMHEDKKAGILEQDLANEYWQTQFENYQNNGGTLSYQQYMQQQLNNKISKEINKRVKDKMQSEGIAAILGVSPGDKI